VITRQNSMRVGRRNSSLGLPTESRITCVMLKGIFDYELKGAAKPEWMEKEKYKTALDSK
jgi:hypothetical protein